MKMFKRRIGHAPFNVAESDLIFRHGVVHVPVDALSVGPMEFSFFLSGDMTDPTTRKKNKIDQNYRKKTNKQKIGLTLNPFERTVQMRGYIFSVKNSQN